MVGTRVMGALGASAIALGVLLCAPPAFAKDPAPRPPLDIKPVLKDAKKTTRAKAKAPKPAEAAKPVEVAKPAEAPAGAPAEPPAGPSLASASSTPVDLPAPPNPVVIPMMQDLRRTLSAVVHTFGPRETNPAYMRVRLSPDELASRAELSPMIAKYAEANGVPEPLVHRVIMRESRYHPRVVSLGNYGLMQIKHGTARAMGYTGTAAGLLDPETNLIYAVKYLAGAYRKANGDHDRAVALYARGY